MIQFRFSLKVTGFTLFFVVLMCWASYWQYTKWVAKEEEIAVLNERVKIEAAPIEEIFTGNWEELYHRRALFKGEWDFEHEFVLRNRKHGDLSGVHIITPFKITSLIPPRYVLVSRGFVPLEFAKKEERKDFQTKARNLFAGLIKSPQERRPLAPKDNFKEGEWLDEWLRIDTSLIQKQLPFTIENVYVEIFPEGMELSAESFLIKKSDREAMLFMPGSSAQLGSLQGNDKSLFPIEQVDLIVPPGRHFSYIFEWMILALLTTLGGLILQLKRYK